MKLKLILFTIALSFISCGTDIEEMKQNLPGYWEITQVTLQDGTKKDFKISTTVDFIEVANDEGVRTKVSPKLNGSFVTNGTAEKFTITEEENRLILNYKTPFASWKETVVDIKKNILKTKNEEGKVYTYKRFEKFNF